MLPTISAGPCDLYLGNCLEVLRQMPDNSVDSVCVDPPYGLKFMNRKWDYDVPSVEIWKECLRVLKPGGHLLAFSGARTYHRMVVNIEDAGFDIRDQVMWIFGQGMPKSADIGKAIDKKLGAVRTEVVGRYQPPGMDKPWNLTKAQDERVVDIFASSRNNLDILAPATEEAKKWDGWATNLKPAHEPIVLARKPFEGTVAENVMEHGTGALNIDGCRVGTTKNVPASVSRASSGTSLSGSIDRSLRNETGNESGHNPNIGRWPANIVHDGSDEVVDAFPDAPGQIAPSIEDGQPQHNKIYGAMRRGGPKHLPRQGESKNASRFFYCAKASRKERGEGNTHETVKPLALMRWLCRLVTPSGGIVLDPFMGSGSTGLAALGEGFKFIGIEVEPKYFEMAKKRIGARTEEMVPPAGFEPA